MKTVVIQIGNSDDKLSQVSWAAFVLAVRTQILEHCRQVHFFGAPSNWERWQNAAWVFECDEEKIPALKLAVRDVRLCFDQDSIAWMEGETQFV